jgi:hypothetical protein
MARCRTRNDTQLDRIALTQLPIEILKLISVLLFSLHPLKMGAIVDFASTCRQIRSSRPPANAGKIFPGKVERVILDSRIYRFCQARVQSVFLLIESLSAFVQLDLLVIIDRLTLKTADLLKHMPFSARLKDLTVALGPEIIDLNFLATYTQLTNLTIIGGGSLHDMSGLLYSKVHRLSILTSTVKDMSMFSELRTVKRLILMRCTNITDISPLGQLKGLEWLWLGNCTGVTDISCLVECSDLSWLLMLGFTGIVPPSLRELIPKITSYDSTGRKSLHRKTQIFP